MEVVNLTGHTITFCRENGPSLPNMAEGVVWAELAERQIGTLRLNGVRVPILRKEAEGCLGLPEPSEGTILIVPKIVAQVLRQRQDLVYASDPVWGEDGRIVAVRSLRRP